MSTTADNPVEGWGLPLSEHLEEYSLSRECSTNGTNTLVLIALFDRCDLFAA